MTTPLPIIASALLLLSAPLALAEGPTQQFDNDLEEAIGSEAWEKHLPFFGDEFRERGHDLFPPFGLSFVTSAFEQDVFVGRHGIMVLEGGYIGRAQLNLSLMLRF